MKNTIDFKFIFDKKTKTITVEKCLNGKYTYKYYTGDANNHDIAQAYRCIAYELLKMAHWKQYNNDFVPPDLDINKQIEIMLKEFK